MMKFSSLALLFSFALVGSSAHAQILNTNGNAVVETGTASVSSDTDITVDADTSTEAPVGESSMSGGATASSGIEFNLLQREIDENARYTITSAGSVRTSASMESYAAALVRADKRLDSIQMHEDGMGMTYRKPAKLLWIFPASLTVDVSVTNEGDVTVRYPWHAFLLSTDEARVNLEAEIKKEVEVIDAAMQTSLAAEAAGTTSGGIKGDPVIRRWARIIEAVYVAVAGEARVDAST